MNQNLKLLLAAMAIPMASCGMQTEAQPQQSDAPAAVEEPVQQSVWENPVDADGYLEVMWEDLLPEGEEERLREMYAMQMQEMLSSGEYIAEGGPNDVGVQIGTYNTVEELNGRKIKMPGYTVPLDFSPAAEIDEFLLVPTLGACVHVPPPPPNQTVFAQLSETMPIRDMPQAVWIRGTLVADTQSTDLADAAYTIIVDDIEEYQYRRR